MRRLRQADWIRRLVRESEVTPSDLIWSMVIHDGEGRIPVGSLPGVERLSVDEAAKAAVRARDLGIPAIAVFPFIDGEKITGTRAIGPAMIDWAKPRTHGTNRAAKSERVTTAANSATSPY